MLWLMDFPLVNHIEKVSDYYSLFLKQYALVIKKANEQVQGKISNLLLLEIL